MAIRFATRRVCGVEELDEHRERGITHLCSLLDPDWETPEALSAFTAETRLHLAFNDILEPKPEKVMPTRDHVRRILEFGAQLEAERQEDAHLLIHCHMGVSRSTAAMTALLAQEHTGESASEIYERLVEIRPQAWPNSVMIGYVDELLDRKGELTAGLGRLYAARIALYPSLGPYMRKHGRGVEVDMAEAAR